MFIPNCLATAVGSFPHRNPEAVVDSIFELIPGIPAWPQLPQRDFRESMYLQFSEGMPCLKLEPADGRAYFRVDCDIEDELEKFYTALVAEDLDYFAVSENYAAGLHHFLNRELPASTLFVKGQVTGPISFGLTMTDQGRRSVIYLPEIFEAVVKTLAMKARWQVRQLKKLHDKVIIFFDEPYLAGFGSAFVNVSREDVLSSLKEVIDAARSEGAMTGLHCCGNTDWSMVMETPVDIVNFDAYEYFKGITLYPEEVNRFLEQKRILAWGIVPATTGLGTTMELHRLFLKQLDVMSGKGIDRRLMLEQCLITTSCGMGTQTEEKSERIMELLWGVSRVMRGEFFTLDTDGR